MKMGEGRTDKLITELANQQISNNNPYVSFAAKVQGVTILLYRS